MAEMVKSAPSERDVVSAIRKKLRHFPAEPSLENWLLTSQPLSHYVLGAGKRGIPYGHVFEVAGPESGGKSGLMMELAREAAEDGADVGWIDLEASWDDEWAVWRGLDPSKVALFQIDLLKRQKKGEQAATYAMMSAEEIFNEAEAWVRYKLMQNPHGKIFLVVDSVSGIVPKVALDNPDSEAMALVARFLSKTLPKWVAIARTHNVILVLINQLRTKPGLVFGDPEYTTGGRAIRFYSHIRVRVKRITGQKGFMWSGGKKVGIKGTILNVKNKAGGQEGAEVGYKFFFHSRAKYVKVSDVKGEVKAST